ncbi:MAG: hypothetical protein EXR28_17220 [Betaproteobacteria bacterium]|nr:hypothetical protein [Betaproteobacteria bacterium]
MTNTLFPAFARWAPSAWYPRRTQWPRRRYRAPGWRIDVGLEGVPDYTIPKAGTKYQDQYNEDFILGVRQNIIKQVVEISGGR